MKRSFWSVSTTIMILLWWQVVSGLAQDFNENAAVPPLETTTSAPAAVPDAALVEAPAVEPVPAPGSMTSSFVEAKPEVFEIDRSPLYPPTEPPAASVPLLGADGWPTVAVKPVPKSFWARWFGAGEPEEVAMALPPLTQAPGAGTEPVAVGEVSQAAPAAKVEKVLEMPEEQVASRESVRRQAQEIEGLKYLDLAYQAMVRNEFDEALKLFDQSLTIMPMRPYTVDTRNKARQAQATCEYRLAVKNYQQGNLEEARKHNLRVLEYVPNHKEALRLQGRVETGIAKSASEGQKPTVAAKAVPLRHDPSYLAKQKRIKTALDKGRQYMAMHEYDKATREFNSILLEDEGHEYANANLLKIAKTGYDFETWQYNRMKAEMMAQVRDTWTPPVKQDIAPRTEQLPGSGVLDKDKDNLLQKLNNIVIPQLEFRQANIVDVIKYLDRQAIIADKTSPAGEKGVNIVLNLKRPGVEGAAAAPNPFAPEGDDLFPDGQVQGDTVAGTAGIPMITLTLRNIVLLEAIKYITGITGLKYRIESNVVMITPADVVVGEVISRTYRVQPNLGDLVRNSAAQVEAPLAIGVELTATRPTTPGGDVRRFFVDAGVPFPEGTSIKYQPSLNLLLVANTAENLEKFEDILKQLNVIPFQVEIEARFVEIGQTDLEELGMEWLLTDDWKIAQDASGGAAVPLSARQRIQVNKNNLTKGLREFGDDSGETTPGGSLGSVLSISSILTNPELTVILHALERRSGANLLSAPKVTTKSGANAEIKVVKEIIYPTEWETGGGALGQQVATAVVLTPASFETRDTGVILNVTPVVGPDGYTIDLTMMPQVVELADWINYGSAVIDPQTLQPITMNNPQPIFHSRSIQTSISIWDGQTVVMGGLITENEATTEDKIPFLGDIPLLGYFFKTKTSKSIKRNLLIFVSANLVDPAGNRINKEPIKAITTTSTAAATP